MKHYLVFTIGPVQDLIESARRCRDLWFGSYLLSEVSKAAASGLLKAGVSFDELIFPAPQSREELNQGSTLNVANRIVALVDDPEAAARSAAAAARQHLQQMADEAFKDFHGNPKVFSQEAALQQLDDLLEIYWVALPLKDYKDTRSRAEALMAARKNTRVFAPAVWAAPVEKCSIDGRREEVLVAGGLPTSKQRRYGLRPGERLCGVAALKRLGAMQEKRAALSTSHVASGSWLRRNKLTVDSPALLDFQNQLAGLVDERDLWSRDGHIDGHLLYEERLLTYVEDTDQEKARKALQALYRRTTGRPGPYYCILLADGDRMGAAIDRLSQSEHRTLTQDLSRFASRTVPDIVVKKHHGYLIYAGGDDILALLPVDQALKASAKLAQAFAEAMRGYGQGGEPPTLSVGLAVRHHLDPLGDGLTAVRRAEKAAKDNQRNSLAVSLDKRGGAEVLVVGKWGMLDATLTRYASWSDRLSTGFAYELREFSAQVGVAASALIQAEVVRIAKRKIGESGRGLDEPEILVLQGDVKQLGALKVAEQLIVARFFHGEGGLDASTRH